MAITTSVLSIVSLAGVLATFYYGVKATRLERARKRLDYSDLQACANDLGSRIKKEFRPDVCFTPGLNGATFANLLVNEMGDGIPTYVGNTFPYEKADEKHKGMESRYINTSKWRVYIPDEVFNYVGEKILLIDDFAMSGDFLQELKALLIRRGFEESHVKSATVAVTRVAQRARKAPDYMWMQADSDDFFFPWGKAS